MFARFMVGRYAICGLVVADLAFETMVHFHSTVGHACLDVDLSRRVRNVVS